MALTASSLEGPPGQEWARGQGHKAGQPLLIAGPHSGLGGSGRQSGSRPGWEEVADPCPSAEPLLRASDWVLPCV